MNVLVLNGSPKGKRSNTYQLTSAFLEGISQKTKEQGNTAPEILELDINLLNVNPCQGCFFCWNKMPGQCSIYDDMGMVLEKLLWADVTIWSFPLYFFNVPGQLKTLIDRQLPLILPFMVERTDGVGNGSHPARYDMSRKRTVLISTCGFYTSEGNYDSVMEMFDHYCGKNNYTTIFCGQGELFVFQNSPRVLGNI
ncbi:MAG: flavodoxin family protein [Phascolarctobacterium sp.]|uniref:flavodoxin family protein n=1 Tax=Phascolarctobacterium sp. TaxID=2049039 RepID=UPI0025E55337|nr:flavodoxin family protein [Phascolarctobacterium sp.]MCC8157722.1 flavodoxin family protein [Phascolarctobacterium sp.]